jgi:hypothetical protein
MTAWQDKIKQAIADHQVVVAAGRPVRHHADQLTLLESFGQDPPGLQMSDLVQQRSTATTALPNAFGFIQMRPGPA